MKNEPILSHSRDLTRNPQVNHLLASDTRQQGTSGRLKQTQQSRSGQLKILNVSQNHYVRGGSDRYFFTLAELLQKHGHRVIPFTAASPKTNRLNGNAISHAARILNIPAQAIYSVFCIHAMPLNPFDDC